VVREEELEAIILFGLDLPLFGLLTLVNVEKLEIVSSKYSDIVAILIFLNEAIILTKIVIGTESPVLHELHVSILQARPTLRPIIAYQSSLALVILDHDGRGYGVPVGGNVVP